MPSGPPPEHVQAFLRQPRPAIIGSLLADGSPSTVATWYLWLGGARLLLSTQKGGFRERNLARVEDAIKQHRAFDAPVERDPSAVRLGRPDQDVRTRGQLLPFVA